MRKQVKKYFQLYSPFSFKESVLLRILFVFISCPIIFLSECSLGFISCILVGVLLTIIDPIPSFKLAPPDPWCNIVFLPCLKRVVPFTHFYFKEEESDLNLPYTFDLLDYELGLFITVFFI